MSRDTAIRLYCSPIQITFKTNDCAVLIYSTIFNQTLLSQMNEKVSFCFNPLERCFVDVTLYMQFVCRNNCIVGDDNMVFLQNQSKTQMIQTIDLIEQLKDLKQKLASNRRNAKDCQIRSRNMRTKYDSKVILTFSAANILI